MSFINRIRFKRYLKAKGFVVGKCSAWGNLITDDSILTYVFFDSFIQGHIVKQRTYSTYNFHISSKRYKYLIETFEKNTTEIYNILKGNLPY